MIFVPLSGAEASEYRSTNNPSQRCAICNQNSRSFLLEACAARRLHWLICSWKKSALWSIAITERPTPGPSINKRLCAVDCSIAAKRGEVSLFRSPRPPINPSWSQTVVDAFGPSPFHILEPNQSSTSGSVDDKNRTPREPAMPVHL